MANPVNPNIFQEGNPVVGAPIVPNSPEKKTPFLADIVNKNILENLKNPPKVIVDKPIDNRQSNASIPSNLQVGPIQYDANGKPLSATGVITQNALTPNESVSVEDMVREAEVAKKRNDMLKNGIYVDENGVIIPEKSKWGTDLRPNFKQITPEEPQKQSETQVQKEIPTVVPTSTVQKEIPTVGPTSTVQPKDKTDVIIPGANLPPRETQEQIEAKRKKTAENAIKWTNIITGALQSIPIGYLQGRQGRPIDLKETLLGQQQAKEEQEAIMKQQRDYEATIRKWQEEQEAKKQGFTAYESDKDRQLQRDLAAIRESNAKQNMLDILNLAGQKQLSPAEQAYEKNYKEYLTINGEQDSDYNRRTYNAMMEAKTKK